MTRLVGLIFLGAACGPLPTMPDGGVECSGNGHLHGDTCHCDRGYASPAGDPKSCVMGTGAGGGGTAAAGGSAGGSMGGGVAGGMAGGMAVGPEAVTLSPSMQQGQYATTHGGGEVWRYGARSGEFTVEIENYSEYGGPAAPGTYTLRGVDADYASCSFCLVVRRGTERYMPVFEAGKTVTFSSLGKRAGERFSGTVNQTVELRQVTINPQTFATTDVPNGKRLALSGLMFSVVLAPPECGGHGHLHGNTCHCDSGYRLDPMNPRNCIPQ